MTVESFDENGRFVGIALLILLSPLRAVSVYTDRIDDRQTVYPTQSEFGVHADGRTDDTEAIQSAINRVQETTGEGILFVPEGRYRVTHTAYVWQGIRVIGYGRTRPVMMLAANTPGCQRGLATPLQVDSARVSAYRYRR
jgi:hypothetical protein